MMSGRDVWWLKSKGALSLKSGHHIHILLRDMGHSYLSQISLLEQLLFQQPACRHARASQRTASAATDASNGMHGTTCKLKHRKTLRMQPRNPNSACKHILKLRESTTSTSVEQETTESQTQRQRRVQPAVMTSLPPQPGPTAPLSCPPQPVGLDSRGMRPGLASKTPRAAARRLRGKTLCKQQRVCIGPTQWSEGGKGGRAGSLRCQRLAPLVL